MLLASTLHVHVELHCAGLVLSFVIGTDSMGQQEEALLVCNVVQAMLKYTTDISTLTVKEGLHLWQLWERGLAPARRLMGGSSSGHLAFSTVSDAAKRLEGFVAKAGLLHIKEIVAAFGLKGSMDKIGSEFKDPGLSKILYTAKTSASWTMANLTLGEEVRAKPSGSLLQQHWATFVKVKNMDLENLRDLSPESHERAEAFMADYEKTVREWFKILRDDVRDCNDILLRYRPPSGLSIIPL